MLTDNRKLVIGYFLIIFAIILVLLYKLFHPFVHTLLVAIILTGLYYPIYRRLVHLLKGKRVLASLTTCLLVFLTVFVPLTYFVIAISNEAYALYLSLTDMIREGRFQAFLVEHRSLLDDLVDRLNRWNVRIHPEELQRNLAEVGKNVAFFVYERARIFISNLAKFFLHSLFLLVVLFYLFLDGMRFRNFLFSLSPLPEEEEQFFVGQFNSMVRVVLVINGLAGIIQGILGGIAFWVLGLPSPLLWGSVMAILAFLPLVGISFVFIPATIFLLLAKHYGVAVLFLGYFTLLSVSVEYLLKPRLVGRQAQMHTLVVLLSIIGGLTAFGLLGVLYGPLIMTAFISVVELYKKTYERALLGPDSSGAERGEQEETLS